MASPTSIRFEPALVGAAGDSHEGEHPMKKLAMTVVCAGALGMFAASASAQDAAKGAKGNTPASGRRP